MVLSILEVAAHAVLAVMFVGWDTGFQYYLLVLAAAMFFTPLGPVPAKAAVFAALFYF